MCAVVRKEAKQGRIERKSNKISLVYWIRSNYPYKVYTSFSFSSLKFLVIWLSQEISKYLINPNCCQENLKHEKSFQVTYTVWGKCMKNMTMCGSLEVLD